MSPKKRKFRPPPGERPYRKMFILAVEGTKTEPQYFAVFNNQNSVIWVYYLKGNHGSSPPQVLARMKNYLKEKGLKKSDEAWLVVDKDQWTDDQLSQLHKWSQKAENHGFALSNPKFEYWLLLHFEDGAALASSRDCTDRLKRHRPGYDKGIGALKITRDQINDAIGRAKLRDNPPCADWPRALGCTTVYKLVERLLPI